MANAGDSRLFVVEQAGRIGSTIVAPNVPALPWPALLLLALALAAATIAVKKPRPFAVLPRLLRYWHALGE